MSDPMPGVKCAVCLSDNETGHKVHRQPLSELGDAITIIEGNAVCLVHVDEAFGLRKRHANGMDHKRRVEHSEHERGNDDYEW